MEKYDHKKIEARWQKRWEKEGAFEAKDNDPRPKFYALIEFPYPSGEGLHVGHPRPYTAMDIIARKRRMEGFNVLYPIGFDAFGLPTENYAIKTGRPPSEVTAQNIKTFTSQIKSLGISFDWSRQVTTTDPKYYKWTQWIFLQFFKHGLAYKKKLPINWCPSCKIGLANEEVVDGACERCGAPVEKREKEQWMLAITKYADKLLQELKEVDYIERAKVQQENWIGRSEGVQYKQRVKDLGFEVEAYDSVPQTFMAQTFAVIAPEHPLVSKLVAGTEYERPVLEFVEKIRNKKRAGKLDLEKEIDGAFTGRYVDNPFGTGDLPIWVASFVVYEYGTGFVNCSAHDERDFAFAKKYEIPLRPVMFPNDPELAKQVRNLEFCYHHDEEGILEAPKEFKGRKWGEAREDIINYLVQKGWGYKKVQYKLRDWVFSRQRYWGEPIPLVYCENCATRKKEVVLVHGIKGGNHWTSWLKQTLEEKGYVVHAPNLPHNSAPVADEWADVLNKLPISDNADVIVVGHSLGCPAACYYVKKSKRKISKLLLVAPVGAAQTEENFDNLRSVDISEDGINSIKNFNNLSSDWKEIKNLVKQATLYLSDNDPYVPLSVEHNYSGLNPRVRAFKNKGHFNTRAGVTTLPEILDDIIDGEDLNPGWMPLPEKDLPLELPKVEKYQPTDTGESPLAAMEKWVKTKCPRCGGAARRETDTMPNWAGSSWYFLRYCDPDNKKEFASMEKLKYWMGVDWYNGGMEHTVLHLLYSRFWNQFLYDIGLVPTREPYKKRTSHGLILAEDGEKMSKSRGNVVNPNEIVEKYGADTLRLYEMFMGPFDQPVPWSTASISGVRRFLERVWALQDKIKVERLETNDGESERLVHKTIKKVTEDVEQMKFNTAIAAMMILVNELTKQDYLLPPTYCVLLQLLNPFAPHITEELWEKMQGEGLLAQQEWPKYDSALVKDEEIELVIQVNGKVRDRLRVSADISEEEAKALVFQNEKVAKWFHGKEIKDVVFVKGKLINVVL